MSIDNCDLRATFDQVAPLYDRVRPGYPAALFENVIEYSGIPSNGHILEIGCGTGQATVPFAQRGYPMVAIEYGANLAAGARRNLEAYPHVELRVGTFEQMVLPSRVFDLAISATAFHWIDPDVGFPKVALALKPRGTLALFWNKHVWSEHTQHYFTAFQEVYLREAPSTTSPNWALPRAETATESTISKMESTNLFGPISIVRYVWEQEYDAESYIGLLNTYSDNRGLKLDVRDRLLTGIRNLIDHRFDGKLTMTYLSLLALARPLQ